VKTYIIILRDMLSSHHEDMPTLRQEETPYFFLTVWRTPIFLLQNLPRGVDCGLEEEESKRCQRVVCEDATETPRGPKSLLCKMRQGSSISLRRSMSVLRGDAKTVPNCGSHERRRPKASALRNRRDLQMASNLWLSGRVPDPLHELQYGEVP
jgi:hypothetical protein